MQQTAGTFWIQYSGELEILSISIVSSSVALKETGENINKNEKYKIIILYLCLLAISKIDVICGKTQLQCKKHILLEHQATEFG